MLCGDSVEDPLFTEFVDIFFKITPNLGRGFTHYVCFFYFLYCYEPTVSSSVRSHSGSVRNNDEAPLTAEDMFNFELGWSLRRAAYSVL